MEHDIILDLLPLYHDGVCSDTSRAAVEEHLNTCEVCRTALAEMDAPLPAAEGIPVGSDIVIVYIPNGFIRNGNHTGLHGRLIHGRIAHHVHLGMG